VAVANQLATLGIASAAAVLSVALSRLSWRQVSRRLLPLNLFMLFLVVLMPLSTGRSPLVELGPVEYSREGLLLALTITLKGNAIVLMLAGLLGSLNLATLGHALSHLRVPDKLIHLLLFTVRYVDVLGGEYRRLSAAMRVRGFRPRANRHAYRTYGYLVGMLLVRSLDRSERIVAAMKCRGFHGRFYLLDHFAFSRGDVWFGLAASLVFFTLAVVEWT